MKRIFLNILFTFSLAFNAANFSTAQAVDLPDLNEPYGEEAEAQAQASPSATPPAEIPTPEAALPDPSLALAPEVPNQANNPANIPSDVLKSAVGDVFNEPTETPPLAVANDFANPEDSKTPEKAPVIEEPSYVEVAKPKGKYASIELQNKPAQPVAPEPIIEEAKIDKAPKNQAEEPTEAEKKPEDKVSGTEVVISMSADESENVKEEIIKPMDENVVDASTPKVLKFEEAENFTQTETTAESTNYAPLFSGVPKSMQKRSANLVTGDSTDSDMLNNNVNQEYKNPSSVSAPENDIDVLSQLVQLPTKNRPVIVQNDVKIERGSFRDPFYEELSGEENIDSTNAGVNATANVNLAQISPETPTNTGAKKEEQAEKKSPAKILTKPQFYDQEKTLNVAVKGSQPNMARSRKDAYDALNFGMYESAIAYYKKILETNPRDKNSLFGLATAYHKATQYGNAKKTYLEIINLDKNYYPAISNYIILVTEENGSKAIPKLEDLWRQNPSFSGIPAQIANLYYKDNNLQKAAEYYFQAVNIEPDSIDYKYNLAVILEKLGESELASKYYKNLLDEAAKGKTLPEDPLTIRDRYFLLVSLEN